MKRAYVKPVFLAEEYVAASNYVAACGTLSWLPQLIKFPTDHKTGDGTHLCENTTCAHSVGSNRNQAIIIKDKYDTNTSYEDYAGWDTSKRPNAGEDEYSATNAYLFNSGHGACDFVWDNTGSDVGVWKKDEKNNNWFVDMIGNFGSFFYGSPANGNGHRPAINGTVIPS